MGERLGKYELVERVAAGGMAELFVARASAQHGFEKTVALKRILPAFSQSEDFIRMFLVEAHIAAGLHHPNIAQVFDFGEDQGTYFFTMEYVHGQTLRQLLAASRRLTPPSRVPLGSVIRIINGIAAGLHHAHEHRDRDGRPLDIVHRDVSPSNVLITYEGHVKLVDFGIAKAASMSNCAGTTAGSLKGKLAYMSPEQCRGEPVDRRSDIFTLGILLWELTTGRTLFRNEGSDMLLLRTVEAADVPRPSDLVPDYPKGLESIVLKALQRDRESRYATALELHDALEDFAVEARIAHSSTQLGRYMADLFPEPRPCTASVTTSLSSLRLEALTPLPTESNSRPAVASTLASGSASRMSSTQMRSTLTDGVRMPQAPTDATLPGAGGETAAARRKWFAISTLALFAFSGGMFSMWRASMPLPAAAPAQRRGAAPQSPPAPVPQVRSAAPVPPAPQPLPLLPAPAQQTPQDREVPEDARAQPEPVAHRNPRRRRAPASRAQPKPQPRRPETRSTRDALVPTPSPTRSPDRGVFLPLRGRPGAMSSGPSPSREDFL